MNQSLSSKKSNLELDVYFLIARFLSRGPCKEASKVLIRELEKNGLLHTSSDWMGEPRPLTYQNAISLFQNLSADHLLDVCQRTVDFLNEELPPPIGATCSLLGTGRYSLLRTKESVRGTVWNFRTFASDIARNPLVVPHDFASKHNWAQTIYGRELGGSKYFGLIKPIDRLFGKMSLHRRILGHLSSVYCTLFDRTGARIFTGSDDCLIKCWSSRDGRLLSTFRGHQSEICDMDVSHENTILASGSCDKEIRIWDLQNGKPITILQGHSAMITSIEFSPLINGDTRYLTSTGRDGNVCFWLWNVKSLEFASYPHKFQERNCPGVAMLCSSWSSGGRFLAVGGSDNLVHIYHIPMNAGDQVAEPASIAEQNEHTDTVDSLKFSYNGLKFITGSKDGTARIWTYEYGSWTSNVLNVTLGDPLPPVVMDRTMTTRSQANASLAKVCVIMVAWDCCDENVMTSLTNYCIKVWNSKTFKLVSILKGHTNEAYCLETHPSEKRLFLSAGHDGNIFLWDILNGQVVMNFYNMLEGQGHGAVFDAKFSRDGNLICCTDSHGHLILFGFGDGEEYAKVPEQQFFHTDYRPLIRDQHGYVLDEQTQQAPHLMPPPFLVDVEGNPYTPRMQRLVPGREICSFSQLIPNLITGENGMPEVLQLENENQLENNVQELSGNGQDVRRVVDQMVNLASQSDHITQSRSASASSSVGLLREGHVAGVRQMHSNAPRSEVASAEDIQALTQRVITPQFSRKENNYNNDKRRTNGHFELTWFRNEHRKQKRRHSRDIIRSQEKEEMTSRKSRARVQIIEAESESESESSSLSDVFRRRRTQAHVHRYSTRSNAPKRSDIITPSERIFTITESVRNLDEESDICDDSMETSSVSSSEEDFSNDMRILRRSNRNKKLKNRRGQEDSGDSSPSCEEDSELNDDLVEQTEITAESIFSPKIEKKTMRKQRKMKCRKKKRSKRRLSSSTSHILDCDNDLDESPPFTDGINKSSSNEDEPCTSLKYQMQASTSERQKQSSNKKKNLKAIPYKITPGEPPPQEYLPPEWISRCTPCQNPYIPQIGDEIVYLRQGHQNYINNVRLHKIWNVTLQDICYEANADIRVVEHCRVINLEYMVGPPTLCHIVLRPTMRKISKKISQDFHVKYHDMANVVDFLVLKQKYEMSMSRSWNPNDRFRSIIDDMWWYGIIVERKIFDPDLPDSPFQCFAVMWDSDKSINNELDLLSPWDLEPIPNHVMLALTHPNTRSKNSANGSHSLEPAEHGIMDPEEIRQVISYKPRPGDWGCVNLNVENSSDVDGSFLEEEMNQECERIALGIDRIIQENMFQEFSQPVDVVEFPLYPLYVPYPTDLSKILQKLRSKFYRRSAGLLWEITSLKDNACNFNEPGTTIVQKAKFLCRFLHKFVETREYDILELLRRFKRRMFSTSHSDSSTLNDQEISMPRMNESLKIDSSSDDVQGNDHSSWILECQHLLRNVMVMEDSLPFRNLQDEYLMDLASAQEKLIKNSYHDPVEFLEDIKLIFVNCKKHNTSREVHSKSTRLSVLMNAQIQTITEKWQKKTSFHKKEKQTLRRSSRHKKSRRTNLNDSIIYDSLDREYVNGKSCTGTNGVCTRQRGYRKVSIRNDSLGDALDYKDESFESVEDGSALSDSDLESMEPEPFSGIESQRQLTTQALQIDGISSEDSSDHSENHSTGGKHKTRNHSVKRRRLESDDDNTSNLSSPEINRTFKIRKIASSENDHSDIEQEDKKTQPKFTRFAQNHKLHARRPTFCKKTPRIHCQLRTTLNRPQRYGDYASDESSGEEFHKPSDDEVPKSSRGQQLSLKSRF